MILQQPCKHSWCESKRIAPIPPFYVSFAACIIAIRMVCAAAFKLRSYLRRTENLRPSCRMQRLFGGALYSRLGRSAPCYRTSIKPAPFSGRTLVTQNSLRPSHTSTSTMTTNIVLPTRILYKQPPPRKVPLQVIMSGQISKVISTELLVRGLAE